MRNRVLLMLLYWIGVSALALASGLPAFMAALFALAGAAALAIPKLGVRYIVECLLVVAAALTLHTLWGTALEAAMAAAALGVARAKRPSPDRVVTLSLIMGVIAVFLDRPTAWIFVPISLLSIWVLVTAPDANRATERHRTRLALTLGLIAGGGAILVGLILHVLPWQFLVAGVFSAIAYPFIALLSRIVPHPHRFRTLNHPPVPFAKHHPPSALSQHAPAAVTITFVVLSAAFLALIIYLGYRYWTREDTTVIDETGEPGIVRETLSAEESKNPWRRSRQHLTPVRRLVHVRQRQSARLKKGRRTSETFREWVQRTSPNTDARDVVGTYDAVRYGDEPDTDDKRRRMEESWPRT